MPACSPRPRLTENQKTQAPSSRQRGPRQPDATTAPPGWIGRWFGRRPRRQAASRRRSSPAGDWTPYSPETHPELTQEACDILNTPIDKLDPVVARLIFAGLARHIAGSVRPGSALTDRQALFVALLDRLASPPGQDAPDPASGQQQEAPPGQPEQPPPVPPEAVADAPPLSPDEAGGASAPGVPDNAATAAIAAADAAPETSFLWQPVLPNPGRRRRVLRHHGRPDFRRYRPDRLTRSQCHRQQFLPPPPQRMYYACAGPP